MPAVAGMHVFNLYYTIRTGIMQGVFVNWDKNREESEASRENGSGSGLAIPRDLWYNRREQGKSRDPGGEASCPEENRIP